MKAIYTLEWDLYGYHGVYTTEIQIGCMFHVQCSYEVDVKNNINDNLETVINYEKVHQFVLETFNIRKALIESVAEELKNGLTQKFSIMQNCKISITKKPPLKYLKSVRLEV